MRQVARALALLLAMALAIAVLLLAGDRGDSGPSSLPNQDTATRHTATDPHGTRVPAAGPVAAEPGDAADAPPDFIQGQIRLPEQRVSASVVRRTGDLWERIRLVEARMKYRQLRVVEQLAREPGGEWRVVRSDMAAAGHIMVGLADGLTVERLQTITDDIGGRVIRDMGLGIFIVSIPADSVDDLPRAIAHFSAFPEVVRYAVADRLVPVTDVIPNDPYFGSLWGLNNTGQVGTVDADIDAPAAWEIGTGSRDVVVGVIDTGVDREHPDLVQNLWVNPGEIAGNGIDDDGNGYVDDVCGWNFVDTNSLAIDDHYHGTHVSGTIGAVGNNNKGVAGVCWAVSIMPLKAFDSTGNGYDSDITSALIYAHMMRTNGVNLKVTNNSYGDSVANMAVLDAIVALDEAGVLFVAAAGNSGVNNDITPHYPASFPCSNIIAVANTDANDGRSGSSCYGPASVDLGAPGASIYSTFPTHKTAQMIYYSLPTNYCAISGTSMATPHVVGTAALIWSLAPWLSMAEVRSLILDHGDPKSALSGKTVTGKRLNAAQSISWIPPVVEHTPLQNSLNTQSVYEVNARFIPGGLMDTNRVWVFWNTNGSTTVFSSNLFVRTSGDSFRAGIPTQAMGTVVSYWIKGRTGKGLEARTPSNAPAAMHTFQVTPPFTCIVGFSPEAFGPVAPDYGSYQYASGAVVRLSAAAATSPENGSRRRCAGWSGGGSVPAGGSSNSVDFVIRKTSSLTWLWTLQYELRQTSSVPGLLDVTTWWDEGADAETIAAPRTLTGGGTNWSFAGWYVDGARQPDPTNTAHNPDTGFLMTEPRSAMALYMPGNLDSDADQLPDWWEILHFGSLVAGTYGDPDADGFANKVEALDLTDPRDPASVPTPPVIQHAPLANPMMTPGPYAISAVVTDGCSVASVTLNWSLNYGPYNTTSMVQGSESLYSGAIPVVTTNGDHFSYFIQARDPSGQESWTAPRSVDVVYPAIAIAPGGVGPVLMRPSSAYETCFSLTNRGLGACAWQAEFGFHDDIERGTNGWSHTGFGDRWHLSTNRWHSASNSWHLGWPAGGSWKYAPSSRAELRTPMVQLFSAPRLEFYHWIDCETDDFGYTWDGGIVEISPDGTNFTQIFPKGGYPYKSHYYQWPQFPLRTPCYAGTGGWQRADFDLSAYENTNACFRFVFASDDNTEYEGWYIDDLLVTSGSGHPEWVEAIPSSGSILPHSAASLKLLLNSTNILTGDRKCHLVVESNDPQTRFVQAPVSITVRSGPEVTISGCAQTSTNGEGIVTIDLEIVDQDSDSADLTIEFSTDAGLTWTNAWVRSVTAYSGSPVISNGSPKSVRQVDTVGFLGLLTNSLDVAWATTNLPSPIALCSSVLVRVRGEDALLGGSAVTSAAFMVDNEAPGLPADFHSTGAAPGTWGTSSVIELAWSAADDGTGIGMGWYECMLATNSVPVPGAAGATTNLTLSLANAPDGTNLTSLLRALDHFGNRGPWTNIGPFFVDTTPPDPSGASVEVAGSRFGNYVVGSPVSGSWSGFVDGMSGLAGYFYSTTDGGGTTNGLWTGSLTGQVDAAVDSTNTFFVWGRDVAGGIGSAASVTFLVVDPASDFDGDGYTSGAEETAGSDAADPGSMFAAADIVPDGDEQAIVISWHGVSNRVYDVYWAPTLTDSWDVAASLTNVPGEDGTIFFTDQVENAQSRFYRLEVRQP